MQSWLLGSNQFRHLRVHPPSPPLAARCPRLCNYLTVGCNQPKSPQKRARIYLTLLPLLVPQPVSALHSLFLTGAQRITWVNPQISVSQGIKLVGEGRTCMWRDNQNKPDSDLMKERWGTWKMALGINAKPQNWQTSGIVKCFIFERAISQQDKGMRTLIILNQR